MSEFRFNVLLEMDDDGSWPPTQVEYLWAEWVDETNQLALVNNVPLFSNQFCYKDIVKLEMNESAWWFSSLIQASDYSSLELLVISKSKLKILAKWIKKMGYPPLEFVTESGMDGQLMVVAIKEQAILEIFTDFLNNIVEENKLEYDYLIKRIS